MLSPWVCNEMGLDLHQGPVLEMGLDEAFDIDECSHQGVPIENVTRIEYPQLLCLASESQTAFAEYHELRRTPGSLATGAREHAGEQLRGHARPVRRRLLAVCTRRIRGDGKQL